MLAPARFVVLVCVFVRVRFVFTHPPAQWLRADAFVKFVHLSAAGRLSGDDKPGGAHCGHCGARVYLEGCAPAMAATRLPSSSTPLFCAPAFLPSTSSPPAKKPRLAVDIIKALGEAKALKDSGCIGSPELAKLKDKLFRGE